jgi:hypothetical protein
MAQSKAERQALSQEQLSETTAAGETVPLAP